MRLDLLVVATLALLGSPAHAQTPEQLLIEEGRLLFQNQTFNGNGRTCASCHPATNSFTIDPKFVRSLKGTDPLFVVKKTKELAELEIKQFLRQGTILENLDTFANPGVMRGVPHTLALRESTSTNRTGWSGDGAPGDGSLRSFATGAVTQHFPKTLNRVPGVDFRLPTEHELDAMEAFQLSLGRQTAPPPLTSLAFNDDTVEEGKELFILSPSRDGAGRGCGGCHVNGGTNNGARATGANLLPTAPACELNVGKGVPIDGGFGSTPIFTTTHKLFCQKGNKNTALVGRGDQTFDVPPVIEAADTPPFFHNNAIAKLEDAVAFYTTDTFNNSIAGAGRAFVLDQGQINAIGAFLRALNAVENIRSSNAYAERSLDPTEPQPASQLVQLALAETEDAIEVLTQGPVKPFPSAVALLRDARQAFKTDVDEAIVLQEAARALIVSP